MAFVAVNLIAWLKLNHLAVNAGIDEALAADGVEEFAVVALAVAYQWSKDVDFVAGIVVAEHLNDFLFGVFHHALAGGIGIGFADAGV